MIRPHRDPRGVTLLEVLFSMLIATIGLLGALALLPVAIEQANKGRQADAQAIAGEAAVSDFKVRGFNSSIEWVTWPPSPPPPPNIHQFVSPNISDAICFDPLAVARYQQLPPPSPPAAAPTANYYPPKFRVTQFSTFPYSSAIGIQRMTRVGRVKYDPFPPPTLPTDPTLLVNSIHFSTAETICKCFDELSYDRPTDRSLDAVQRYSGLRREVQPLREFSWLATLVPPNSNTDERILSVVVFYRRPLPEAAAFDVVPDPSVERIVDVTFNGSGDSGGEVTISGATDADLAIRNGEWIMLATQSATGPYFRWYRVIDTEPTATSTAGVYYRNVTLFGADWPAQYLKANSIPTRGVIVTGVSAVYERTIRLQQSNLWQ